MCLPLYFKFVIIPSLQLLLRTVFTSVGFKTSRFHLKISNVNLNFPDVHQRHSRGHGLPEMSLRDRPRSFPLPNCCCLNIELEINAPSLKHFSNPPVSVSCLCDADDDHLRFSLGRYLRPVQGTHLCITVTRPSSLAPWIPFPICHPYEYLPLLAPTSSSRRDGQSLLGRVDLLRRIW